MHTGESLINYLYELRTDGRKKITSFDLSYNQNLPTNTIISIFEQLPNLKTLKMRGIGFDHGQVPTKLLESLPKLKNIDISDNHLSCVRNVFKGLTIKKLSYSGNPELEEKTGR